jgi:hypothetical protein
MVKILIRSIKDLWKKPFLVLFVYAIGFVLAMIVARPFYVTILNEANSSVALDRLIADFDFLIFSDFMNQSAKAFKPFVPLVAFLGFVYLLLSTFFAGGILDSTEQQKFTVSRFLQASAQYFGRFAMLLVYLIIFVAALLALSGMFFFIFASIKENGNERDYFLLMLPPIAILAYFIGFAIVLGDYARVMLFKSESLSALDAFWKSFSYIFKRQGTVLLFWIIIVLGLVLSTIYLGIDGAIGMHSGFTIFVMFLIQQIFVFARTFLKVLTLVSAKNYFESNPVSLEKTLVKSTDLPEIEI